MCSHRLGWFWFFCVPQSRAECRPCGAHVDSGGSCLQLTAGSAVSPSLARCPRALRPLPRTPSVSRCPCGPCPPACPPQAQRAEVKSKHSRLLREYHESFHHVWGRLLKTGYQNSRYAHQVGEAGDAGNGARAGGRKRRLHWPLPCIPRACSWVPRPVLASELARNLPALPAFNSAQMDRFACL
jgi:hypothetical protein